jgi:hypothetical protein
MLIPRFAAGLCYDRRTEEKTALFSNRTRVAATLAALALPLGEAQAAALKVTSAAFQEGEMTSAKYAGHQTRCRRADRLRRRASVRPEPPPPIGRRATIR